MFVRGIRGAIRVKKNSRDEIERASLKLMRSLIRENDIDPDSVACVIFTVTGDLNADFPARPIRKMGNGWQFVPLLCTKEIDVPGAMDRMLRILVLANTTRPQRLVKHQYLGEAKKLRKDVGGRKK